MVTVTGTLQVAKRLADESARALIDGRRHRAVELLMLARQALDEVESAREAQRLIERVRLAAGR